MATVEKLREWYERDLARYASWDKAVDVRERGDGAVSLDIFTSVNRYTITARDRGDGTAYLGCISQCRKPRAGEDWHRGNDLADGEFSEKTWHRILGDIISFELVKLHTTESVPLPKSAVNEGTVAHPDAEEPVAAS